MNQARTRRIVTVFTLLLVATPTLASAQTFFPADPPTGDPTAPANDTRFWAQPLIQGPMNDYFQNDASQEFNRTIERTHDLNATASKTTLWISATMVGSGGTDSDFNVTLLQNGTRVATCEARFIVDGLFDVNSERTHKLCGPNDDTPEEGFTQPFLQDGNVTVRFSMTGNPPALSNSHISAGILVEDEVQPVVHDALAQSTLGAYTASDALWVTLWLLLAAWSLMRLLYFAAGISFTAALSGALAPVMDVPFFGPEDGVLAVTLFLLALLLASMKWIKEQTTDSEEGSPQ